MKFLREHTDKAKLAGVDTFNSVLFGQENGDRLLGGLGNSIIPKNLVHQYYDEVHWVSAGEAFLATRQLHREKALFCGPTTGAAYMVASHIANNEKKRPVLFISPDEGNRYVSSVYSNDWLKRNRVLLDLLPRVPKLVTDPKDAKQQWSYINWDRRKLSDVIEKLK